MSNPPLEIDPTPILPTSFLSLTDKRLVGSAVPFTEVYEISAPPPLPEAQPSPFVAMIRLREAPQQLSTNLNVNVLIPGFTEVLSTPSAGQFLVNYGNGDIFFNASQIGTNAVVSYYGTGSIVTAADINNITGPLVPFYNKLDGIVPDLPAPQIFTFPGGIAGLMQRNTFIATHGQTVFNATFPVTADSTLLFSDGLLMTEGVSADYILGISGTFGTSVSASPATIVSGGTLTLNLNGDGVQIITLGTDATGAAIAADIQARVRALTAHTGGNQPAYNNFTATYDEDTGLYTLTSGTTGTGSSVVITGASEAIKLLLGTARGGIEISGMGSGAIAPGAPNLAAAAIFAVLGSSTVTNTGSSVLTGSLGLSPGTSITGFPPGTFTGSEFIADSTSSLAQTNAQTAYAFLASSVPTKPVNTTLSSATLTAGVYPYSSSASLTGVLTLNGSATDVFIFQIGSTLTTASSASVVLTGGALPQNVFWQVGSSATLGTSTSFQGTIIAEASITANAGTTVNGRLIALTGAVTLGSTNVTVPSTATSGTSVSAFPATSLSGGTITISLNGGSPHTITLGTDNTGAAIAADIQSQVRSLFSLNPIYAGFTASFNSLTGLYTLTSGTTGVGSSVVITGSSNAAEMLLGIAYNGDETAGTSGTSQIIFNGPRDLGAIVNIVKIGV